MPTHREDQIAHAQAVKARHANQLMSVPGVVSVGVGLRQQSGRLTDEVAIIVMVGEKAPPGKVPAAERLPAQLDGVPVDVQQAGEIKAG